MENLHIYKNSIELVKEIYKLTYEPARLKNDYSLVDQLRRASVSIPANIAEGYFRTKKQFMNHLKISSGSANEVIALLIIVQEVYKIDVSKTKSSYNVLRNQILALSNKLKK
ncbi:hypothetical protein A3H80_01345 [Candidatus Roizmanbacteria bacterium RIFCSPLOWO2_02_FULL_37_19]|uniref:Four helix bundle protein n=1 Tax=Candidatus Roizmanbacteria bacterium RIFCSPHIGHO2_02_FULL_37_24 TaxID=1802037 RepID=A0A1F7GVA6_9BACT|nr:MAG: hypothetical protein A2862_01370 [Candidatus Roizmanbacteria bacterium RIFCSPHIGHO2_01_FULL_38_41]OGK23017.1 MAG: hypothetical protein A3C24_02660 [Candidatus Roizmanbacteria bacterium RIFCSPHIGHO2_02_FULL_37_24]OGK32758.1 MAG: hypothetical protein A3E10_01175 [Candidatus Roizmanbacteria bacterium RIFCSPHIGHO2_12_FULL_37_23]OGK53836.1 MAG: hypothetical protein A3H80_01345 [Candidatus Roizmanbacteria bacterium RIFCSPLOWO2_02_FULL_37_19]